VVHRLSGPVQTGQRSICYPLTITDHASRFLLTCEALEFNREMPVIESFERLFRERGLPIAIRSDNGVPFANPNGLYTLSLSKLSGLMAPPQQASSNPDADEVEAGRQPEDAFDAVNEQN
jgi:hypothetical protein